MSEHNPKKVRAWRATIDAWTKSGQTINAFCRDRKLTRRRRQSVQPFRPHRRSKSELPAGVPCRLQGLHPRRCLQRRAPQRPASRVLDARPSLLRGGRTESPAGGRGARLHPHALRRREGTQGRTGATRRAVYQFRPIAVGRANWLQIGGDGGLPTASVLLSICASARRNHLNRWAYLTHVLTELPTHSAEADLTDLPPDVWAKASGQTQRRAA